MRSELTCLLSQRDAWDDLLLPDLVTHMRGVRRAVGLADLEVDVLLEAVEQPLACAEDHRCRGDHQLVDLPGRERLPDEVGATTDGDVAVTGGLGGLLEGGVEVRDEREAA